MYYTEQFAELGFNECIIPEYEGVLRIYPSNFLQCWRKISGDDQEIDTLVYFVYRENSQGEDLGLSYSVFVNDIEVFHKIFKYDNFEGVAHEIVRGGSQFDKIRQWLSQNYKYEKDIPMWEAELQTIIEFMEI